MSQSIDPSSPVKFEIKPLTWSEYEFETPTLLQDLNGPCPLISLVNTLLLNYEINNKNIILNEIKINETQKSKLDGLNSLKGLLAKRQQDVKYIELNELLLQLGDLLLVYSKDKSPNFDISQLLESLPKLHTGLSVNPNLVSGTFPSDDIASQLFEIFELKFRHGWCLDPIDNENVEWNNGTDNDDNYSKLVELFNNLQTFDKIQDYLLINLDNVDKTNEEKLSILQNQRLIKKWFNLNKTQLTKIGLKKMNLNLDNEEFIIFFRNNHFNTLFKKSDMEFYLLVTDSSFKSNKIVWQSLISINGSEDLFFNGEFLPIMDIESDQHESNDQDYDQDYLLTKQLQEEEDERLAKEMQQKYDKPRTTHRSAPKETKSESDNKKIKKKKLNCCII